MVDNLPVSERKVAVKREICGTRKGYLKHLRHGEYGCSECREANSIQSWINKHPGKTEKDYYDSRESFRLRMEKLTSDPDYFSNKNKKEQKGPPKENTFSTAPELSDAMKKKVVQNAAKRLIARHRPEFNRLVASERANVS